MSWIRKGRGRAGLSFPTFIAGSAIENVGGGHCPPDNPSVGFADTSLYTREALAAAAGFGQTGSSAPANRTGTIKKSRLRKVNTHKDNK